MTLFAALNQKKKLNASFSEEVFQGLGTVAARSPPPGGGEEADPGPTPGSGSPSQAPARLPAPHPASSECPPDGGSWFQAARPFLFLAAPLTSPSLSVFASKTRK